MRRIMILLMLLLAILAVGCAEEKPIVGGDKDEHGCIGSAGYTWCAAKEKCLREWEEPCVKESQAVGEVGVELVEPPEE